jgi:hypothetical protein
MLAAGSALAGFARYLIIAVGPVLTFGAALAAPRLLEPVADWWHRRRRVTTRPPIERLSADLRRLRTAVRDGHQPTYVRRTGTLRAYDDVLSATCRALEVPTRLAELPDGVERDVERLLAEAAVEHAGIPLDPH